MSQPHDSAVAATGLAHDHLDWPFFEPRHRALARELDAWAAAHVRDRHGDDVDADCRALVRALGGAGWLTHAVGGRAFGGAADAIDTRAICILRETLARHNGLADFAFAMQGLGSGAISLAGTEAQKQAWLPDLVAGKALAGFGLTPEALAVADIATEAKKPMVIFNAATSIITTKSPYIARTSMTLPQISAPMGTWAAKNGIKKVITLVADYGPGNDAEGAFKKTFTA